MPTMRPEENEKFQDEVRGAGESWFSRKMRQAKRSFGWSLGAELVVVLILILGIAIMYFTR